MLAAKSQEDVQKCLPQNRKNIVIRSATTSPRTRTRTRSRSTRRASTPRSPRPPRAGTSAATSSSMPSARRRPTSCRRPRRPSRSTATAAASPAATSPASTARRPRAASRRRRTTSRIRAAPPARRTSTTSSSRRRIGYTYSYDRIGRGPNNFQHDFNPLKGTLDTHEFEAGVTFVMSPTAILVVGGTARVRARRSIAAVSLHPDVRPGHGRAVRARTAPRSTSSTARGFRSGRSSSSRPSAIATPSARASTSA